MNFQFTSIISFLFIALISFQSCTSENLIEDLEPQTIESNSTITNDCYIESCTDIEIEINLQSQTVNGALTCFEWQPISSRTALDMNIDWEVNTLTLSFNEHKICGSSATLSSSVNNCEKSIWDNVEHDDIQTELVFDLNNCLRESDYLMISCSLIIQ